MWNNDPSLTLEVLTTVRTYISSSTRYNHLFRKKGLHIISTKVCIDYNGYTVEDVIYGVDHKLRPIANCILSSSKAYECI